MNDKTVSQVKEDLNDAVQQGIRWGNDFGKQNIKCCLTSKLRVEASINGQTVCMSADDAKALSDYLLAVVRQHENVINSSGSSTEAYVAEDFYSDAIAIIENIQKTSTSRARLFFNAKLLSHVHDSQKRLTNGLYDHSFG